MIGNKLMNQFIEQNNGIMRPLVSDVAFDEDVPRHQRGLFDLVEDGAGVVEVVDFGVGVERKEAGGD
ncbi:hypothetical protein ACFXTO_046683 [Malus domestica]